MAFAMIGRLIHVKAIAFVKLVNKQGFKRMLTSEVDAILFSKV